jgi:pantetheine-phosphate adenylyltransferase
MLKNATSKYKAVRVERFSGLLVHYLKWKNATVIIRGLRAVSDFEYEFQMALMNRKLDRIAETVFLMPDESYTYLSSRMVKEVYCLGGDIKGLVPAVVGQYMREKFRTNSKGRRCA